MNSPYAHVSRTALAVLAAAGAVWLSAYFLPGSGVQPIPLLPAIGSAAGKVVAASEPSVKKHVAAPHRTTTTFFAPRTPAAPVTFVPQAAAPRPEPRTVQRPQPAHPRHHAPRTKRSRPLHPAAPASASAPAPPAAAPVFASAGPRGRAVGWHRKHDQATAPAAPAPARLHGNGHSKHAPSAQAAPAHRHGNAHSKHNAPSAKGSPAPAAPAAAPSAPADSHDNGKHVGDEHGHSNQGHGPGGKK